MEIRGSHRNLIAWRKAMALVLLVYRETAGFPAEEIYGLKSQIRRSAVSIPSNIAEGTARNTLKEWVQFLGIACGSAAELETQVELAIELGYLQPGTPLMRNVTYVAMLVRRLRIAMLQREKSL
jgi:four helix bundle protein